MNNLSHHLPFPLPNPTSHSPLSPHWTFVLSAHIATLVWSCTILRVATLPTDSIGGLRTHSNRVTKNFKFFFFENEYHICMSIFILLGW